MSYCVSAVGHYRTFPTCLKILYHWSRSLTSTWKERLGKSCPMSREIVLRRLFQTLHVIKPMDWEKTWHHLGDKVPWQMKGPHPTLMRNIHVLTAGKEGLRILVPLCGMSYDMIWLADQGHTIVGIEAIKAPIEAFFEENQLEYDLNPTNMDASGAYIYKAKTKDITIVQCDFWSFRKVTVSREDFDAVWDRAAFIAIFKTGQESEISTGRKYLELLRDALGPGGRILIETILYDPEDKKDNTGPDLCTDESLKEICGDDWAMERVELIPLKPGEHIQNFALPYYIELSVHLLTPK